MKTLAVIVLAGMLALPAAAFDLGNRAPAKAAGSTAPPPPDPEVLRQGGDTVADAVRIPIPTVDLAGTTTGYTDDYDVECPYGGSTSPDVVYSIVSAVDQMLDIDLCGSRYDTRVWVWDATLDWPIACNDDYYYDDDCGHYTSKIENLAVSAGAEYFIVVDGYGGEHGEYLIDVVPSDDCDVDCPPGADLEGEPPLEADYADWFNGGCNTDEADPPLQSLGAPLFCGVSGWYLHGGDVYHDTDWFTTRIPAGGVLEVSILGALDTALMEIGPHDCSNVGILQEVTSDDCSEAALTVVGEPGETVWLFVRPGGYAPWEMPFDAYEYDYELITNLAPVAVEDRSWTEVKALFD